MESETQDLLKEKIKKSMQREYQKNKETHEKNMLRRIVSYAIKKHKNCP